MAYTSISYDIIARIAVLSQNGNVSKELNLISYNGAPAKYDLRSWRRQDGEERLLKGITLNAAEMAALKKAIADL